MQAFVTALVANPHCVITQREGMQAFVKALEACLTDREGGDEGDEGDEGEADEQENQEEQEEQEEAEKDEDDEQQGADVSDTATLHLLPANSF
jgi:hypothetical protein